MRKSFLPLLLAVFLPAAGCAYLPLLPAAADLATTIGPRGYAAEDFGAAANEACLARATRHGRAIVTGIQAQSESTMRVTGTVEDGYRTHNFVCLFRSDGAVTSFKLG